MIKKQKECRVTSVKGRGIFPSTPDPRPSEAKDSKEKTMRIDFVKKTMGMAMALMLFGFAPLGTAQDKPADNLQILRAKIKADKKLVVATNMELTESEAKGFWPIYDAYQKDLQKINRRIAGLLDRYAADFHSKSLTDDKAKKLIDEALAIEQAEADLKKNYVGKLSKALPVVKAARYLQVENKIRAVVKYDLAQGVPLAR
jgi:predicted outer membrane protein